MKPAPPSPPPNLLYRGGNPSPISPLQRHNRWADWAILGGQAVLILSAILLVVAIVVAAVSLS